MPILSSIAAIRERKVCIFAAIVFLAMGGLSAGAPSPTPHLSEADELERQVQELFKAGKYSEAIPLATQSLHLREKALGPENPEALSLATKFLGFRVKSARLEARQSVA